MKSYLNILFPHTGIDGSTTSSEREKLIDSFNRRDNKLAKLFLLSTRFVLFHSAPCFFLALSSFYDLDLNRIVNVSEVEGNRHGSIVWLMRMVEKTFEFKYCFNV